MSLQSPISRLGSYSNVEQRLAQTARGNAPTSPLPLPVQPMAQTGYTAFQPWATPTPTWSYTHAPASNPTIASISGPSTGTSPTLDDLEAGSGGLLTTSLNVVPDAGPQIAEVSRSNGVRPSWGASGGHIRSRILKEGDTGGDVASLQRTLAQAGFNPGTADGIMGPLTTQALKAFQASRGLPADGEAGPQTRAGLRAATGQTPAAAPQAPTAPATTAAPARQVQGRLATALNNRYKGVVHQCFMYAWTLAGVAGGRSITKAPVSFTGRNAPVSYLDTLERNGSLKLGDVVYVNKRPGADPSSTNMAYGPHWFVYMGNSRFADQYGVRDAAAMQAFVPGRRIDAIYHPFETSNNATYQV